MRTSHENLEMFIRDLREHHPVVVEAYRNIEQRTHSPERELKRAYPGKTILPKDELRISLEAVHQKRSPVRKVFEGVRDGSIPVGEAVDLLKED